MKLIRYLSLMAVLLCSIAVNGHPKPADDEEVKYRLTVIADPSVGCSVSGSGNYAAGAEVFLRSTAGTGFVFQSWTREDGTIVSTSANFTYTKLEGDETLTAHFKYDPSSPDDPVTPVFPDKEKKDKYILKLLTEEGGTNLSGSGEYEPATVVTISVGIQANFTFVGWYDEKGMEIGTTSTLNYTMGEEDVTLTARFNYTPDSPSDPDKPVFPDKPSPLPTHTVTLMATEGGSVSGGGTFEEGSVVTINASTAANFTFAGWFCADTLYTADATFTYTIDEEDIVFEARFDYTPGSPGDPDIPVFPDKPKPSHNVCVTASPTEGGSVSVSVNPVEEEHSTRLSASPATGFVFTGWYSADTLYSDNATVDYLMGTEDVAFEARFDYNPGSPDDPAMPATDKFSLYLSTVRAMPGRTVQYPIYLNTQDTVCDMRFHLTFPKGTTPDMTNIRISGKAVGYTLTYEKIETNGVKAFREPRRAPEESPDSTVYAISLTGGKTAPCNTRLLTIAVTVDENFQGTGNQKVGINQISMTNTDGNTETAAARHGSLMMRESSELGLYYYLTLISTGSGTTRVGSKSVRNALQVVEMLEGTSTNIYFTPDNGYHLDRVTKDDVDISDQVTDNRLLISDVKDDIQLEVSYAEGASASWPLTVTATGHGTVTFDDTVVQNGEQIFNVSHGAEAVLTVKPEKGYHVAAVTIDGKDALSKLTANGKLTIESMSASVTVAVTFAANVYDVTFRYGETVYKQTEVAYGDPITAPEDPTLKGHTFAGWMPEVPETMPDSALVFMAQFKVNQYTATFTIPSEDWKQVLTLDYGAAITAPTPPLKPGYTFVGWDKDIPATMPDSALVFTGSYTQNMQGLTLTAEGNGSIKYGEVSVRDASQTFDVAELSNVELTIIPDKGYHVATLGIDGEDALSQLTAEGKVTIQNVSASVTVAVTFSPNVYDVTFRYGETVYQQTEVAYGDPITAPEDPTLKGHTFAGWIPEVPETMPDSALVFTAQFKVNQYTATFTIPSEDWKQVLTLDYGAAITPPTPPQKPGYTFAGWDKDIPATMPDSALVFTGSYTQNMQGLTLTAEGNGAIKYGEVSVRDASQTFDVAELSTVDLTIAPDKGYHVATVGIDGEDALSQLKTDGKLTIQNISASVTVSVTFVPNVYDVTFRYGETVYQQTEVAYGDPITAPEDPTLKGHTFAGWMPEVPETMPDSALVFTAQFTVNQYTVTFTVPSVDWQEVLTLDYGAAIEAPTPPEWTDYTFVGWDNEIPALMPDYDLTFTGLYTQNPVTITAMSYTVEYGNPLPEFSYSSEGATITGKPQIICEAVQGSPVGTYPIVITKGSVTNDNDTYINGTLIIVKAPLTITLAEDYTRYEGDDNPEFKFAYSGWKMNDDESVLTEKPTATCEAGVLSPAGDYPVFISGGAAENYEVTCMNGILKVLSFESSDSITVSIVVDGIGFVRLRGQEVYDEGSVRVPRGANAVLELQAEAEGNVLSKLSVNGKGVTGKVRQGVYVIPHVEGDVSVHALFSGDIVSFTVDGINYTVTSFAQHTVKVVTGDYEGNIVVPDEVEYEAEIWTVRGLSKYAFFDCPQLSAISVPASVQIIENNFVRGCPHLAAIEWQTSKELTWPMLTNYRNPNMLFYAKDRALIPSDAQNIVINGYADRIVLTDMTNRGDFYCPTAFTAGEIMYQHTYAQSTKIGKCQGWESIVLPFNVQDIRHAEKGVIHPFAALSQEMIDSDAAPFWLYKFSDEGFVHSAEIEANVPYIISMPNDSRYEEEYILGGQVTFSATNVEVRPSSEAVAVVGSDRSFCPTYQSIELGEPNCYLLNVSDEFAGHAEGSVFARYRREGRPFEAYFSMADGGGVKEFIGVFEEMQDGIESLFPDPSPVREGSAGAVYDLSGRKLINHHSSNHKLHYGIYIKDGKKIVVK